MITNKKEMAFKKIIDEFEKLSNLILNQLDLLDKLFKAKDNTFHKEIIQQIIENEKRTNKFDNKLDNLIINAIVLYKPVASDLRKLFAIYRMVNNLERISDLIVKISNYIIEINNFNLFKKSSSVLNNMLQTTSEIVSKSLLSFFNNNKDYALWTISKNNDIGNIHHKLLKKSIKQIKHEIISDSLLLDLIDIKSIISSLERIGDHAANIAEASIYGIFGENIKHKKIYIENKTTK